MRTMIPVQAHIQLLSSSPDHLTSMTHSHLSIPDLLFTSPALLDMRICLFSSSSCLLKKKLSSLLLNRYYTVLTFILFHLYYM
ncbi:hypothetical protein PO909_016169 [Leuciscus waleckii]